MNIVPIRAIIPVKGDLTRNQINTEMPKNKTPIKINIEFTFIYLLP